MVIIQGDRQMSKTTCSNESLPLSVKLYLKLKNQLSQKQNTKGFTSMSLLTNPKQQKKSLLNWESVYILFIRILG